MSAAEPFIPRKVWTRTEIDRLSFDGLSLELVNGELIDRMGKRPPHNYWKTILGNWLREQYGDEYVRSEDPIDVAPADNPTSEPEPDLSVTYHSIRQTRGANPKPEDLRLVVEVSDSTYDYDTKVKAALYARARIQEYWVVDVRQADEARLLLHLDPKNGSYRDVRNHGSEVNAVVLDGRRLRLADLT